MGLCSSTKTVRKDDWKDLNDHIRECAARERQQQRQQQQPPTEFSEFDVPVIEVAAETDFATYGFIPRTTPIPVVAASEGRPRENDANDTCTVCWAKYRDVNEPLVFLRTCGHVFCRSCIQQWMREGASCPICRAEADEEDIQTLFMPNPSYTEHEISAYREETLKLREEVRALQDQLRFYMDRATPSSSSLNSSILPDN